MNFPESPYKPLTDLNNVENPASAEPENVNGPEVKTANADEVKDHNAEVEAKPEFTMADHETFKKERLDKLKEKSLKVISTLLLLASIGLGVSTIYSFITGLYPLAKIGLGLGSTLYTGVGGLILSNFGDYLGDVSRKIAMRREARKVNTNG